MLKFICKILGLCCHEWETFQHIQVKDTESKWIHAHVYHQKCKHCGKLKRVRFNN